jgi:hypothetical protein
MGALIRLAAPAPASTAAARVYYAVGRSLTAADFDRQSQYISGRLLGLTPTVTGVMTGLDATYDAQHRTITIGMGYGIGADGRVVRVSAPIVIALADLAQAVTGSTTLANGAYLLFVRTVEFDGLEGPPPDPALRASPDPLLDVRQDSFVEVWLSPSLGSLPVLFTPAGGALAINTLVGGLTQASIGAAVGNGVPLALVAVQTRFALPPAHPQVITVSQGAGRLPARPDGLNAMLLAQLREVIGLALTETGADPTSAAWQASLRTRFRFLPPAGELPVGMLLAAASTAPNCPFFPPGMELYLQFIRASQAPHLLYQALGRPSIDLDSNTAEAVTLSLAVPDAAWTPDLIDIPRGDPVLAADLHLAYARARAAQVKAREAWIALYGGVNFFIAAAPQIFGFLMDADTAAQDLDYLLNAGTLTLTTLLDAVQAISANQVQSTATPKLAAEVTVTPELQAAGVTPQLALTPQILFLIWLFMMIKMLTAAGSTPPKPVPAPTAAAAAAQFAALGYQTVDTEPAQADPAVAPHAPAASDDLLAPLLASLPPNSGFADWSAAISAGTPDPVLLQPLIDAGIINAGDDADTRASAIAGLLALPAGNDTLNDDHQPGMLLTLALLQMFYAVLTRIAWAHEHLLNAHSRFIALQRQHLDIMSTYVSALAGGVPSDGSGLGFTRMIPFFNLTASSGGSTNNTAVRMMALRTTTTSASTSLAAVSPSVVRGITANGTSDSVPARSRVGATLGSANDIARTVATEMGALSQAPPFSYQPVQYGAAAHITSGATIQQIATTGLAALRDQMTKGLNLRAAPLPTPTPTPTGSQIDDETAAYANIAASTRALLGDITLVENNAIQIENTYFQLRDALGAMETRIAQVTVSVGSTRDALRNAQAVAAQTVGDYAAAQRLVLEEIARVTAATDARNQAIAAATGLFFERELLTLTTRRLPRALALTADTPADLVPGCPADHAGPPASLQPFLNLLLEVPLGDWSALRGGWTGLPDQTGLQRLGAVRAARLATWTMPASFGAGAAATDLASLAQTTRDAFSPLFSSAITLSPSLAMTQQAAFSVLSLPDIVALPVSLLRSNSEALRSRLESATGCLFETLTALPPSARFAWASLARARTLPLLSFAQWPLPAGLGDAGTATLRRLAALVSWITGQLHDASSAAGQTALANLVAAAVMAAAYGDPDEAVTGSVATTGGVPRPGVPIRIVLNRPPPIGTVLNLLDETQSIVGTIRVQDHDAVGTTATVVTSFARTAPTSGWTVGTPQARAPWLPS